MNGLSIRAKAVLFVLRKFPDRTFTFGEIAAEIDSTPAGVRKLVRSLESAGFSAEAHRIAGERDLFTQREITRRRQARAQRLARKEA